MITFQSKRYSIIIIWIMIDYIICLPFRVIRRSIKKRNIFSEKENSEKETLAYNIREILCRSNKFLSILDVLYASHVPCTIITFLMAVEKMSLCMSNAAIFGWIERKNVRRMPKHAYKKHLRIYSTLSCPHTAIAFELIHSMFLFCQQLRNKSQVK